METICFLFERGLARCQLPVPLEDQDALRVGPMRKPRPYCSNDGNPAPGSILGPAVAARLAQRLPAETMKRGFSTLLVDCVVNYVACPVPYGEAGLNVAYRC